MTSNTDFQPTKPFGKTSNAEEVLAYTLKNKNGVEAVIIPYGATVVSLKTPSKDNKLVDVVLGYDNLQSYLDSFEIPGAPYFGAIVGRCASRIKNATFVLNDKKYILNKNTGNDSLHGGVYGFSRAIWKVKNTNFGTNPSITMTHTSADMDEGFPGELNVEVTYTLTEENQLKVSYNATTNQDTIVNLTHHSYFNLDGHKHTIEEQEVTVHATQMLEFDETSIPTGNFQDLKGHKFDFSSPSKCPTKIDNSFVVKDNKAVAAKLHSKKNNISMEVYTDQPSVHIYVGGFCGDVKGKENTTYNTLSGICFETQKYPNSANIKHFPSTVLKKGDIYKQETIYAFKF